MHFKSHRENHIGIWILIMYATEWMGAGTIVCLFVWFLFWFKLILKWCNRWNHYTLILHVELLNCLWSGHRAHKTVVGVSRSCICALFVYPQTLWRMIVRCDRERYIIILFEGRCIIAFELQINGWAICMLYCSLSFTMAVYIHFCVYMQYYAPYLPIGWWWR